MPRSSHPDPERALNAARRLLDWWAQQPVSRWLALAAGFAADLDASATDKEAPGTRVPARVASFEEWMVRDLVDTAWQMAVRDIPRVPDAEGRCARHLVERMALSRVVRDDLDESGRLTITAGPCPRTATAKTSA